MVTVIREDTEAHAGPGYSFDVINIVQPRESYEVVRREERWYMIEMECDDCPDSSIEGWVWELDVIRTPVVERHSCLWPLKPKLSLENFALKWNLVPAF